MQNEIEATIQLDKLDLCFTSIVEDNFNHAIMFYPEEAFKFSHSFGKTVLTKTIDDRKRYAYCYKVHHAGYYMGKIKFGLIGQPQHNDKIWFNMHNQVDYRYYLQYLPSVFENLNLKLNNVTRVEIALDSYFIYFGLYIRRCIRNKDNKIKLFGKYIDRKKRESRIRYWNYGSPNNPYDVKTIYIKNKRKTNYSNKKKQGAEEGSNGNDSKTTIEMIGYDKLEEIQDFSPHKTYILDYHKDHNPNYKHIYREEIRLESEELRRLEKKRKKPTTLTDLLSKEFLYEVFTEYIDRIIVIRDGKGNKIDLFPKPFLGSCGGKLPLTLPQDDAAYQSIENKEFPVIENENNILCKNKLLLHPKYNKEILLPKIKKNQLSIPKAEVIIEPTEKSVNSVIVYILKYAKNYKGNLIEKKSIYKMAASLTKDKEIIKKAITKCSDDQWINFFYNDFDCLINTKCLNKVSNLELGVLDYKQLYDKVFNTV